MILFTSFFIADSSIIFNWIDADLGVLLTSTSTKSRHWCYYLIVVAEGRGNTWRKGGESVSLYVQP
jgi:hypothetical protein